MRTREEVEKLAHLARIGISAEEAERIRQDADAILEYVALVSDVDAGDAEHRLGSNYNVLRDDTHAHEPGAYTDELLSAVPHTDASGKRVQVKKVLRQE